MSHAEDASSIPGMYVWRLPTTCNQLQQFQLLVLDSTGTCCTCVVYTHVDADTDMQIKKKKKIPPKVPLRKRFEEFCWWGCFCGLARAVITHCSLSLLPQRYFCPLRKRRPPSYSAAVCHLG